MSVKGQGALPVYVSTDRPRGGPVQRVVVASAGPYIGGAALPVRVVTDADLASGGYTLSGDTVPLPVYAVASGPYVSAPPIPVYVVSGALTAFAPSDLAGLALWTKADAISGKTAGDSVTTWADLSGRGNDLTAPGTAPTYQVVSGAPVVRNSATSYLKNTGFGINTRAVSVFAVFAPAAVASGQKLIGFGASSALVWNQANSELGTQTTQLGLYGLPMTNGTFYAGGFVVNADGSIPVSLSGRTSLRDRNTNGDLAPATTLTDLYVGTFGGLTNNWQGDLKELLIYTRSLSAAEARQVLSYLAGRHGLSLRTSGDLIVFDGDSHTVGYSSASPGYTDRVLAGATNYWLGYNAGVNGQTTAQMAADAPTQIDALISNAYSRKIVVLWPAVTDFVALDVAATYAGNVAYCQARRAAGAKVVIATMLPRTDAGAPVNFEVNRLALNALIMANWATFADAPADVGGDATIGTALAPNDTLLYSDKLHLTSAGDAIAAPYITTAIGTL